MTSLAGRSCPLAYQYGPQAVARAIESQARTLYVVGGLYGNLAALDAIEALAAQEAGPVTLCFNGDFNWFNVDDDAFLEINERVLKWRATAGNVEFELANGEGEAGCGCAYPDTVDDATVARSNRIHARLARTAARHPLIVQRLAPLPLVARFVVGQCRVGVVHGDAESLAGWRFGVDALAAPQTGDGLVRAFEGAGVDVFASSHTCLPVLKRVLHRGDSAPALRGVVVNNGAAGMPNFAGARGGLITRIGSTQAPKNFPVVYGSHIAGAHVQAVGVEFDAKRWMQEFLANWPVGSDAHDSYHARLCGQVAFEPAQAFL